MASLYIHIPFCVKRCIYCDFYSDTCMDYFDAYMRALLCEMEVRRAEWQDQPFQTIYFGGGTPSQIQPCELKTILEAIYRYFQVAAKPEITLEANPDDLSDNYVASLTALPVNRISIGVQSFNDKELCFLNRRHTAQEAIDAVIRCKEAGLTNISIDLIFGIPEQSVGSWVRSIDQAIALDIPHLSAYNLTYEPGTVLYQMMQNREIVPVADDRCAQFYSMLQDKLTDAGFVHYEISNFARRSKQCPSGQISLHNASYWNGTHYLGLGAAAHSYNGSSRSWNVSSIPDYINGHYSNNPVPFCESELIDGRTGYNDFVITRLRTMWGVSLNELREKFGKQREAYFLEKSKYFFSINKLKKQGDYVKVSYKDFFISDAILRELIVL